MDVPHPLTDPHPNFTNDFFKEHEAIKKHTGQTTNTLIKGTNMSMKKNGDYSVWRECHSTENNILHEHIWSYST